MLVSLEWEVPGLAFVSRLGMSSALLTTPVAVEGELVMSSVPSLVVVEVLVEALETSEVVPVRRMGAVVVLVTSEVVLELHLEEEVQTVVLRVAEELKSVVLGVVEEEVLPLETRCGRTRAVQLLQLSSLLV